MGAIDVDAAEFKAFARKLAAVEPKTKRALRKRIMEAGKPLADAVMEDAPRELPSGLREWLRASKSGLSLTQTRLAIRLSRRRGNDLAAINRGRLRHPVFGNRRVWVSQSVPAGAYDRAFEKHADEAVPVVARALDDIAKEL